MLIESEFKPAWWMRNRHLQTILPRLYPVPCDFSPVHQEFELSDGDFVELTWSRHPESIAANQPIVLVLHGLEGSFDSFYAKRMMNTIHRQGWVAVLMHFRGCGKKTNRFAQSYHSGQTMDVTEFIAHLKRRFASQPTFAIGFSLGGNVLSKYLGEQPESGLDGAVIISAPFNLAACAQAIGRGFARVYQKYLVDKLKNSIKAKLAAFQGKFPLDINLTDLDRTKSLIEFDNKVTAPLNGFAHAEDYYRQSSGEQFLKFCRTRTLIIHAKDDPFMTQAVIPKGEALSATIRCEVSEKGGHVGFIGGWNPLNPEFWTETRSVRFINQWLKQQA